MTKEGLIKSLIEDGYLKSRPVIDAFKAVDRKDFVPLKLKDQAYQNTALPIGNKQTISQPLVVAFMLEILELKSGEKVLEIGTGSGWKTALMAKITGSQAKIFSLERISELHVFAKENLKKYGLVDSETVELVVGDGSKGYEAGAPYDKIIAAASAQEIPKAWEEQLKIGGRIVAPVKESIVVVDKVAKGEFRYKEYFGFSFVPLVSDK
jgi:protein-L-isoaspartate(D-aspartate) O-methyltransferase